MSHKTALAFFLIFLILGCDFKDKNTALNYATSDEIMLLADQTHKNKNIKLIDLRTPVEIQNTGIIPGATINNYLSKEFEDSLKKLDKEKTYIVYCKSGGRSAKAASKMRALGLNVKDYSEGMNGWLSKKNKTLHTYEPTAH